MNIMDGTVLPAIPVGIHQNVDVSEYHKRRLGVVSKSALDLIHRSPAHYKAWVDGLEEEATPALLFGSAWHMALLEPARFSSVYVVKPDFGDCRYKANKEARDRWLEDNSGKTPLDTKDSERIKGMIAAVHAHPTASRLIQDGTSEVTIRWTDGVSGLPCKSRADYWVRSKRLVVDAKSTIDASPEAFAKSVYNYRYHVQDALYRAGFAASGEQIDHFALLAVEKEPPYAVAVYTLDADAVTRGHGAARMDIETMAGCVTRMDFPGYGNGVQELSLPRWAA